MKWESLGKNFDGTETFHGYDEDTDTTIIAKDYKDTTKTILDNNAAMRADGSHWKGHFRHVATLPPEIIDLWKVQHGVDVYNKDHWPKVVALMNDIDFRNVKTVDKII